MKTLTPYYGGKANSIGEYIAANLPQHRVYIEPCGGMGGVLMQKLPSFQEVYNDIDGNIVNLFRVVRNKKNCKELVRRLKLTPYSREEWKYCLTHYRNEEDSIERARMVYVVLAMGFLSKLTGKSFNFGGLKYQSCVSRTFFNGVKAIEGIGARLNSIIIENQDALKVAKRWDSPHTCIYLDPPYMPETRVTKSDYLHEMDLRQHVKLLDWSLKAKSMILISGYYTDLYASKLEPAGWIRKEVETYARGSQANGGGQDSKRIECVWFNPAAMDARRLPLFESLSFSN